MTFTGPMSFAAADLGHHVRETVEPHQRAVVLDFSDVPFLDVSAARAVETVAVDAKDAQDLYVAGLNDAGVEPFGSLGPMRRLRKTPSSPRASTPCGKRSLPEADDWRWPRPLGRGPGPTTRESNG